MTLEALDIELHRIEEGERLRPIDIDEVAKIAVSFRERGQISPIEVMIDPKRIGHYRLVVGAHRLAAAGEIGMETIRAILFQGTEDEARLREIDENLYRHELNAYDQANFLVERREIFERLHGAVHPGRPKGKKGQAGPFSERAGFYRETAAQFGLSERTIKRALQRRNRIDPDVWKSLRGRAIGKSGTELDLLAKQDRPRQVEIARETFERGSSVSEAVRRRKPAVTMPERAERAVQAFERLSGPERAEFWRLMRARKLMPSGGK